MVPFLSCWLADWPDIHAQASYDMGYQEGYKQGYEEGRRAAAPRPRAREANGVQGVRISLFSVC